MRVARELRREMDALASAAAGGGGVNAGGTVTAVNVKAGEPTLVVAELEAATVGGGGEDVVGVRCGH